MARSPGRAVSDRELAELRILSALLVNYSSWVAGAITEALRGSTADILEVVLDEQFQTVVVEPTLDAAVMEGYKDRAGATLSQYTVVTDAIDVIKAIREYAAAKALTKRGTRGLLRDALTPDAKVLERVPDQLVAIGGKGAPRLVHPKLPFVERGMSYRDRMTATARTLSTGMEGWAARKQAERDGDELRWVTMRDNKVRPAHVHAQGQTVPYDEPFYVGTYPMWFPGDPSAPEELTVNCRCSLAIIKAPERRWVQRYQPTEWLNAAGTSGIPAVAPASTPGGALTAAGDAPAQARAPKGTSIGGQWIDTPGAILRSLNRLESGTDLGENMRPVEEMRAERRRLAAEILEREGRPSLEETAARVTDIYDMTTPEQRAAGKAWYEESTGLAQEMVDNPVTEMNMEQAAAAIAHLSTQTRWEANAEYARALASGMDQDQALAYLKGRIADGSVPRPRMGGDFLLSRNWEKAQSALGSEHPVGDNSTFGTFTEKNKTRTFASNILGDQDGVTVDVHMQRVLGQTLKPVGKVKGLNQTYREDQLYESLAEAVRVAADARGITPAEMQAITWTWALASHKPARGGNPGRLVDATTGTVLPEFLTAALDPLTPDAPSWDGEPMPDYHYAQAERLVGIPRQVAPELSPPVRDDLTASADQARAPMGAPGGIGGEFIDTPGGLARGIQEGTLWSEPGDDTGVYVLPEFTGEERTVEENQAILEAGMKVPAQDKVIPYTGGAYRLANDDLRGGGDEHVSGFVDNPDAPRSEWTKNGESAAQITANLDSQVAPLSDDMVLYRNFTTEGIPGGDAGLLVGKVISDKAFMSSSYDASRYGPKDTADPRFIGRTLRIRAPKGTPVVWAQPVSAFPQEAEVILDRGTRLAITGYDPATGFVDVTVVQEPVITAAASPTQARAPRGTPIGGQWIDTPGALLDGLSPGDPGYVPPDDPTLDAIAANKDKPGRLDGTGTVDDPIYVGEDLDRAMDLLGEGKYVRIDGNDDDLKVLTDKLAAEARGTSIDICKVSIDQNLFCSGTKGRPRVTMPQFSSENPLPGSIAATMPKDKGGAVNMSDQFKADLTSRGIGFTTASRPADHYLPAQSEMLASKSAGIAKALQAGKKMPGTVFVSRDGYVIDGHHRWAAVNLNTAQGFGDGMMDVEIVDMDITDVLHYANQWTEDMGLPHADILGVPVSSDAAKAADKRLAARLRALAAASTPTQARAPKGAEIGGQWIDTPSGLRDRVTRIYEDRRGNIEVIGDAPANQIGGGARAKYAAPLEDNSPASALQANPNGGDINCQKCTTVYEMRRRGMDVVAETGVGENVGASKGLGDYFSAPTPTRLADVVPFTDNATDKMRASAEFLNATHGPNSRGAIQMAWSSGGAHVFNWEVDSEGTVHYMDAQVQREITGAELTKTFTSATAYSIRFQRLDNVGIGNPAQDVVDQSLTPLYSEPEQAAAA